MRGVLFDLDGTLLDIDLASFIARYFQSLAEFSMPLLPPGVDAGSFVDAIHAGTRAMMSRHPGRTNRAVFTEEVRRLIGLDLDAVWSEYERFYREMFPRLREGAGPAPGARAAVTAALDLGATVVIATNPIFPLAAVRERMAWAELDDLPIAAVTSFETMTACKPDGTYFREAAALAGLDARECLMVGDDRYLDMPAADVGMRTFFVGDADGAWADSSGTLDDLARLLPLLLRASAG
ncbi:MAG: HAD hydrolase-like protein [Coriobacteriia bacterium]|nr:HAD hydrolase-like protein [Coriobacteriia bacterium]